MKTKTAYRPKNVPVEETPNIPDEPPQPSETTHIEFSTDAEPVEERRYSLEEVLPVEATAATVEPTTPIGDATAALQKQLAALRASEQAQRQAAMMAAQAQPPTREQLIQSWRSQGADEGDLAFMEATPRLFQNLELCRFAADEAEQMGHRRGTDEHRQATLENFDRHLAHLQTQQAAAAERPTPAPGPTPEFFRPPPPAPAPDRSGIYSAPVSRTAPSGTYREPVPTSVRLTPEEIQIASASGISQTEYAKQKLRLLRAKSAGELQ
jgi:hypothetical protein